MVDFQSRDTSRGVEGEGTTDDVENGAADDAETREREPVDDGGSETGTTPADGATDGAGLDATSAGQAPTDEGSVARSGTDDVAVALLVTDGTAEAATDAVAQALDGTHDVLERERQAGDLDAIQSAVKRCLDRDAVDAVVTVGGVGIGPDQVTVAAVEPLLDERLPGFGELFRGRYANEVGSRAIRTRAFAGISGRTPVVCLPGETDAADVATTDLLVPELAWLVSAASGD